MKKELEFIVITESVTQSWLRDASTFALFTALIGLGVMLDSTAMQWVGAIIGFTILFAKCGGVSKRLSRTEAIEYLKKMENEHADTV